MSYTFPVIPIGRDETDRRLENVINRLQRHCKIGKISPKPPKSIHQVPDAFDILKIMSQPIGQPTIYRGYMDKCGCKVGSSCGNAACPHRLVATAS